MAVRVALITLLLGSTLLLDAFGDEPTVEHAQFPLLFLIIGVYAFTLLHAFLLKLLPNHLKGLALWQIVGDLMLTTAVIWLTGGADSPFLFLLSLIVLSASILLNRAGGLSFSLVAIVIAILFTVQQGMGFGLPQAASNEALRRILVNTFTHVIAIFLIGLLSGYLSDQLRATGQRLRFANQDLAELEALNRQIITSIRSGLLSYRTDFTVLFANPAALQLLGLTLEELMAKPINERFPKLASASAHNADWEETYITGETERILQLSVSPLQKEDQPSGWILSIHDQTLLRQVEQKAERSARLAAIGKMAAGIAHEIRNPLAAMSGSIQILSDMAEPDSLEMRLSGIIQREAERLNHLITDFLRLARPAPPQKARFDVQLWLEEIVSLFKAEASEVEFTLCCPEGTTLEADGEQLRQVIWNLLKNAQEAKAQKMTLAVIPESDCISLKLCDDGLGISPESQKKIFDPFFTTKETGSGLGLAVVHRIIEEHGGQIDLQSRPGSTEFTLRLPRESAAKLSHEEPQ